MSSYLKALRQFNRDLWLTLAVWALLAFAYFGVMAVLFNLYLLRLGYTPPLIGLLVGVGQLVWALSALPAGLVGARWGTRMTMFLGIILITGGWVLLLLAEALPASLPVAGLFAGWMLSWAGGALFVVNLTPFLMNITTAATRSYAFAVQGAVTSLFALLGSLVGGILPSWWAAQLGATLAHASPYWAALWLMPLACGLAALLFLLTRRVQPTARKSTPVIGPRAASANAGRGLLIFLGLLVFLETLGEGVVRAFFNLYLDAGLQVPTARIGAIFSVAQGLPIVAALITPVIMARLGKVATMSLTMGGVALTLLLLAVSTGATLAGAGYLGFLAITAILGPTLMLFSQEAVAEDQRATVAAVFTLGFALGSSLAALVGGYVVAALGFAALFLSGMTAVLLALLLLQGYLRMGLMLGSILSTHTSQPMRPAQLTPDGST